MQRLPQIMPSSWEVLLVLYLLLLLSFFATYWHDGTPWPFCSPDPSKLDMNFDSKGQRSTWDHEFSRPYTPDVLYKDSASKMSSSWEEVCCCCCVAVVLRCCFMLLFVKFFRHILTHRDYFSILLLPWTNVAQPELWFKTTPWLQR